MGFLNAILNIFQFILYQVKKNNRNKNNLQYKIMKCLARLKNSSCCLIDNLTESLLQLMRILII